MAFIIEIFSRSIVGWQTSTTMHTDFVLDALEQAIHARQPGRGFTHHSDRGSQYLSIRYSERLEEADIAASVGCKRDSHDNALGETVNGLYKTEVIHHRRPWRNRPSVEWATFGVGPLVQHGATPWILGIYFPSRSGGKLP